jgi:hypothetical protein
VVTVLGAGTRRICALNVGRTRQEEITVDRPVPEEAPAVVRQEVMEVQAVAAAVMAMETGDPRTEADPRVEAVVTI